MPFACGQSLQKVMYSWPSAQERGQFRPPNKMMYELELCWKQETQPKLASVKCECYFQKMGRSMSSGAQGLIIVTTLAMTQIQLPECCSDSAP